MVKNIALFLVLAAVLVLPFALRPSGKSGRPADETLVVITPHNEAIRHEFTRAFRDWHRERTGRTADIDWRTIGGTSEIARYLEGEYVAAFRNHWTGALGRPWSLTVQSAFANGRLPEDASDVAREARAAFLASDVGCGIDLFFGGGAYDFIVQARAGRLVDSGVTAAHPEWFTDDILPLRHAGDDYRDPEGRWIGVVLSSFGLIVNHDELARLGLPTPTGWPDLADARYARSVALADPTKSGSMNKAFENVLQQQIHAVVRARLDTARFADEESRRAAEAAAVAEGWEVGLVLLQRIAANARYFTDSAQKVPIDVAAGNCAVGMCIDFYGRQQVEALSRRGGGARVGYVSPAGGTAYSVDPIGMLRGAPNPELARAFIEFTVSPEGQRLWNRRPGTPGGPEQFALRRLPVRKDAYSAEVDALRSDPEEKPYALTDPLVYRGEWTGGLFGELRFIIRVMCIDPHAELVEAWRAVEAAGRPPEAMARLLDVSAVDYAAASGRIKDALRARDKVAEIRLAGELGAHFRAQYREAARLARESR